jgi:hypothetical protein
MKSVTKSLHEMIIRVADGLGYYSFIVYILNIKHINYFYVPA